MGSQVGPESTRFDFNLERGMTKEEIQTVETQINTWISKALPVETKVMNIDAATKAGALSFFEEKYEDEVRVLFIGDEQIKASIELCGGTHVSNLKEIEKVLIASEGSVAAGIRRIKLLAATVASAYQKEQEELAKKQAEEEAQKEQARLEAKAKQKALLEKLNSQFEKIQSQAQTQSDSVSLIINIADYLQEEIDSEIGKEFIETSFERLKQNSKLPAFVFLAFASGDKAVFMAISSPELTKDPQSCFNAASAVKLAAQICGGGGGGKPNFAQAGGKDTSKISEAIAAVKKTLTTVNSI